MNGVDSKINFLLIEIISHLMVINLMDKPFKNFDVVMSRQGHF